MFQSFEVASDSADSAARIAALRQKMRQSGLDAWLVPHSDEYQNEYLPACGERLSWLTGFTGSAGFCIVLRDRAFLFVDGRYTLQAARQTDSEIFTIEDLIGLPPSKWIEKNIAKEALIGFDPSLLTIAEAEKFAKAAKKAGAETKPGENLIDAVWEDRPSPPLGQIEIHDVKLAGIAAKEKIADIQKATKEAGAQMCLLTDPAALAWTFNIRGNDVAHTPLVLGHALVPVSEKPLLFLDSRKFDNRTRNTLANMADLHEPLQLEQQLTEAVTDKQVLCDRGKVSERFRLLIETAGGTVTSGRDPVTLLRAVKNETEIAGSRAAHLRDGVALTRFLAWLDRQQPGSQDEISAVTKLEEVRAETAREMGSELRDIAFETISGAGANGAVVHYRVTGESNSILLADSLYLVDSGAQYADGTTDITRTVAIGNPPTGAAHDFTLVLKGHIAIATARFPAGTRGMDLDVLARIALWRQGKDYAHGTGHGIGSYLSVHEGPQNISKRGTEPLLAGMILSNEPGFYSEGEYGIRIENLVLVRPAGKITGGNIAVHEFETLSLAPIDRRLIEIALLTRDEIDWLNVYHERVRTELSPHLDEKDRTWLVEATLPIHE